MDKIFNLSKKKNIKYASLFYFIFVIIGALVSGVISAVIVAVFYPDATTFEEGAKLGYFYGSRVAMFYCLILSVLLAVKKSLGLNPVALFLIIISPILGFVFGCIGGIIPVTILTVLEPKNNTSQIECQSNDNNSSSIQQ